MLEEEGEENVYSITYGEVSFEEMYALIKSYLSQDKNSEYEDHIENNICIHIDAGLNGPSSQWVDEISGWVKACGFLCVIKPDSYMASTIANRLSK